MTILIANLVLAVVWAMMFGELTAANLLVGYAVGYVALLIAVHPGTRRSPYFAKVWETISLVIYFLAELVIANVKMAIWTLSPLSRLRPMIIAVPLHEDLTDTELTVLANMITLTPGTLSLDVSEDRSTLFVHFMNVDDPAEEVRSIKEGFERRLLAVTRGAAPGVVADGSGGGI